MLEKKYSSRLSSVQMDKVELVKTAFNVFTWTAPPSQHVCAAPGSYILVCDVWETAHLMSGLDVYISACNTVLFHVCNPDAAGSIILAFYSVARRLPQFNLAHSFLDGLVWH